MSAPTLTGWKQRITEFCDERGIVKSDSAVRRLAAKIHKRAQVMQEMDPDDLIRSVLCYSDPTGERAVRNVLEGAA